ncbi:ATP-binding cassette domain-containing protein [Fluviicola taffensis]|uniref:Vitamin B12-transporting ATPase n=1 Tax=Fluviicola taffensis (strain DSM 16823 / NCIMB 13979 / RW262) TaxID=755732 RepID=F2IG54_FLUTR|nr:ATP-binding cassette domain-containing protein [Fluviicola taffensis]AEA44689.1 Vitamin B12-transporting ATPase [Fluviicola taffensis DSM 16823]
MIEAKQISFGVKGKQILQPVDFTTDKEEFVVILGPNGAGKSTLVKLLSSGLKQSSGTISYYGKDLNEWTLDNLSKYRAYMHQESMIASNFTVREVLEMARYRYPETKNQFNKFIMDKIVTELNLHSFLEMEFNFLSGGEKQRVQFGRVLLQLESEGEIQPIKYLFLDEPLNNLDVRYQIELLKYARKFVDDKRGSVIVVMHDINLCYQYADRVLLMQKGKVIMDGRVDEVMNPQILSETYQIELEQIQALDGEVFYRHVSYSSNLLDKSQL